MERKDICLPHIQRHITLCGHRSVEHNTHTTCIQESTLSVAPLHTGLSQTHRGLETLEGHPKWRQSKLRLAQTAVTRNSSVNKNSCEHAIICTDPDNSRHACLLPDTQYKVPTLWVRLHTPSHALRSMHMFQIPTNLCIVTDSYSRTNVNLFQIGFHIDSVINIHITEQLIYTHRYSWPQPMQAQRNVTVAQPDANQL